MTRRGVVLVLLATAPLPWLLALLTTLLWAWVWSGGDGSVPRWLLGPMMISAPLPVVVLVGVGILMTVLRRTGRERPGTWWLVGGSAATLAFLAAMLEGLILAGEGGAVIAGYWALLSGYTFFVFCGGAYMWSRPSVW